MRVYFSREGSIASIRFSKGLLVKTNKQTNKNSLRSICLEAEVLGRLGRCERLRCVLKQEPRQVEMGGVGPVERAAWTGKWRQEVCKEHPFFWIRYWRTGCQQIERVGWRHIVGIIDVWTFSCWQLGATKDLWATNDRTRVLLWDGEYCGWLLNCRRD